MLNLLYESLRAMQENIIWTEEEKRIKRDLLKRRGFPRWRFLNGNFLYCLYGYHWYDEVVHQGNHRWSAGEKKNGTYREFHRLQDAIQYAEKLSTPRLQSYRLNQARIRLQSNRKEWQPDNDSIGLIS
jgi:hypothetical protein